MNPATLVIGIAVAALCLVGLGFNIIFRKDGQFPDGEISTNPEMKKRGIVCSREEDLKILREKEIRDGKKIRVSNATQSMPRGKAHQRDTAACDEIGCHLCDEISSIRKRKSQDAR